MTSKSSFFVKLILGLCLLLAANSAFGATLPPCSTMTVPNSLCGVITGTLTLISGPDPLNLAGSTITAITGTVNTLGNGYSAGWPLVGAPVNPSSSASYSGIPLALTSTASPLELSCTGGAGVQLATSSTNDSLNVTSCDIFGSATFTANINFASGTLPQPIPIPFAAVPLITSGSNASTATYTCTSSLICSILGEPTVLGFSSGTLQSNCEGCTTMGVTPPTSTGLTFTMNQGGPNPAPQTVGTTDSPVVAISFAATASTTSGGNWLSISSPNGGQIDGTPSSVTVNVNATSLAAGTYNGSVTVYAGARNSPVVEPVKLVVMGAPLTITTTSPLPTGEVGVQYSDTLTATGGVTPYTWSISSGSLPPGLTLTASSGLISGSPTTAGAYTFGVSVKDNANTTAALPSLSPLTPAPPLIPKPCPPAPSAPPTTQP